MTIKVPSAKRKEWLGALAERYHGSLLLRGEVTDYLANRGLDSECVSSARLGLVDDPDPLHEKWRGWLAIPYITPTGVVHMRFRCLAGIKDPRHECDDHGKYEGPPGEENRLYNVSALHDSDDHVGITEGELDALCASAAGLLSVGVPGAKSFKAHWFRLFDDYERVIGLGDGDQSGRSFIAKLGDRMHNLLARPMPEGYDVTDYIVEFGAKSFLDYADPDATMTQEK